MSTVITGASGHLGRLVIDQLLAAGTSPAQIVATGRDAGKLTDLAQNGVTVRRADFADPGTLDEVFAGAEAMVLFSTTTVGERFDNARTAIDAAARAGVSRIVYTSIVNASTAQMTLADTHRRTEDYLRDSGSAFVMPPLQPQISSPVPVGRLARSRPAVACGPVPGCSRVAVPAGPGRSFPVRRR